MKKLLKENSGVALIMVIIVAVFSIMVIVALAALAYYNYANINAQNKRSNAYYIADRGMEQTIKNMETIVQSAKIYANEKLREETGGLQSDYERLTGDPSLTPDTFNVEFRRRFEKYYREYINKLQVNDTVDTASTINDSKADGLDLLNKNVKDSTPITDLVALSNDTSKCYQLPGDSTLRYATNIIKKNTTIIGGTDYNLYLDPNPNNSEDYNVGVTVTGWVYKNGKATFVRKVYAEIGISPWGYSDSVSANTDIDLDEDLVYSSPQWASAIASSGDVLVSGGAVTVKGDIYVNGYAPSYDLRTNNALPDSSIYGGLVVGHSGNAGNLTVNGNIYSTNYVHTKYPGSKINVKHRVGSISDDDYNNAVDDIYNTPNDTNTSIDESLYSESATNLKSKSGDPLNLGSTVLASLWNKQVEKSYIEYLKSTFKIQKKYGGFIYANNIQTERDDSGLLNPLDQDINIDGSAIVFDNLETDGNGTITLGNNFYGFMKEGKQYGRNDYNQSSSIIINNPDSAINIGQRIYNAGLAYVTAFADVNGTDDDKNGELEYEPYMTGESAAIFKNYYAYRNPLSTVTKDDGSAFETKYFSPFNFVFFQKTAGAGEDFVSKLAQIFEYDKLTGGLFDLTFSQGGQGLDKGLLVLNKSIYRESYLNDTIDPTKNTDMGYSLGVLIGKNTLDESFKAITRADGADPTGSLKQSKESLTISSFQNYISDKYATLMQMKALKSVDNQIVTIRELIGAGLSAGDFLSYKAPDDYDANFVAADEDLTVEPSGNNLIIRGSGTHQFVVTGSHTFKGLIFSTGKITIESDSDITIEGAVISAADPNISTGIEFRGAGTKDITYSKQIMLNIFRLPYKEVPAAKTVRDLLTSKRGSVELFNKIYIQQKNNHDASSGDTGFYQVVEDIIADNTNVLNVDTKDQAIEYIANFYELAVADDQDLSDINKVSSDIVNNILATGSNNYKIFKWKTIQ